MKHRWGEKLVVNANKTERECQHGCGIVKVTRHEFDSQIAVHWIEFWCGLERIEGETTPPCTGRAKAVAYNAGNHPL